LICVSDQDVAATMAIIAADAAVVTAVDMPEDMAEAGGSSNISRYYD